MCNFWARYILQNLKVNLVVRLVSTRLSTQSLFWNRMDELEIIEPI